MNNHNREKYQTIASFRKEFGIHITTKHEGKMEGMASLSTSPLLNTFCKARCKCKGTICSQCYSLSMQKRYSELSKCLKNNYAVLTREIIPVEKMPIVNYLMFRFESFGDVQNETQLINYLNLCARNPRTQFTIWTKNMGIFDRLFTRGYKGVEYRKPKNLIIIVSSPVVNMRVNLKRYPYADKVFTVYTEEYAKGAGISINCGARSCASCQMCYNRANRVKYVNEILKK